MINIGRNGERGIDFYFIILSFFFSYKVKVIYFKMFFFLMFLGRVYFNDKIDEFKK